MFTPKTPLLLLLLLLFLPGEQHRVFKLKSEIVMMRNWKPGRQKGSVWREFTTPRSGVYISAEISVRYKRQAKPTNQRSILARKTEKLQRKFGCCLCWWCTCTTISFLKRMLEKWCSWKLLSIFPTNRLRSMQPASLVFRWRIMVVWRLLALLTTWVL